MSFWKYTIFWENVKKTLAVFTGAAVYTLHDLQVADVTMMITVGLSMLAAILSIWFVDHDKDGIVDIFQKNKIKKEE